MPDGDDVDDDGTILSDEDPVEIGAHAFHCETCNTIFSNLDQFMDHCNVHCVGGESGASFKFNIYLLNDALMRERDVAQR